MRLLQRLGTGQGNTAKIGVKHICPPKLGHHLRGHKKPEHPLAPPPPPPPYVPPTPQPAVLPALTSPGDAKTLAMLAATRLSYGLRPGELDRIRHMGFDAWVAEQLAPAQIDDSAADARLAEIRATQQSNAQLLDSKTLQAEKRDLARELVNAAVVRAVFSKRQLAEVMTEFWNDHFNIDIGKSLCLPLKFQDDQRNRTHALGRFRDLLGNSAHSPAMLYYLDNRSNQAKGPNENYAREIMELHTLGVNGGYTEQDVKEVARVFTGWTVDAATGEFKFDAARHDNGSKTVLGHSIGPGGAAEGEQVLDILAAHRSTASFIARKLCRRLVSDSPSNALVAEVSAVFSASRGDIAAVVHAIVMSADFAASLGKKLRRPFDLAVAGIRALDATLEISDLLARAIDAQCNAMGQSLFRCQPPTGYPDTAPAWLTASNLLARWAFVQALAGGRIDGVKVNLAPLIGAATTPEAIVAALNQALLDGSLPHASRQAIAAWLAGSQAPTLPLTAAVLAQRLPVAVGLMLACPDFQVK
jgi:uncharacterized protein (DUF1800 family)